MCVTWSKGPISSNIMVWWLTWAANNSWILGKIFLFRALFSQVCHQAPTCSSFLPQQPDSDVLFDARDVSQVFISKLFSTLNTHCHCAFSPSELSLTAENLADIHIPPELTCCILLPLTISNQARMITHLSVQDILSCCSSSGWNLIRFLYFHFTSWLSPWSVKGLCACSYP